MTGLIELYFSPPMVHTNNVFYYISYDIYTISTSQKVRTLQMAGRFFLETDVELYCHK